MGKSPESKEVQQFRVGLRDAGYTEGRDVVIEWRSAHGDYGNDGVRSCLLPVSACARNQGRKGPPYTL